MKRIIACVFLTLWFALTIQSAELPKPEGYVNDLAHLLSAEQKVSLEKRLRQYEHETGIEVAVLTVANLQGESVEQFTQDVFTKWGIGKKSSDNGILFLIAPNPDRKARIQTGYGMEPFMTDAQCGDILRKFVRPHTKKEEWGLGITEGVEGIISFLGDRPLAELRKERQKKTALAQDNLRVVIIVLVWVIVLILLVLPLVLSRSRKAFRRREMVLPFAPIKPRASAGGLSLYHSNKEGHSGRRPTRQSEPPVSYNTSDDSSKSAGSSSNPGFGGGGSLPGADFGGGGSGGGGASSDC